MSFSVSLDSPDLEWAGTDLPSLFAQLGNLARPAFWGMLGDIRRFNRETTRMAHEGHFPVASLGDYLSAHHYGEAFRDWYLIPMAAAIWSCPTRKYLPRAANATIMGIGYQYFGGLTTWINDNGTINNAPSPDKLSNAKPNWRLAAEANLKYVSPGNSAGQIGWGYDGYVSGQPARVPHRRSGKEHPDGGNVLFVDGSVRWIRFENMFFMHNTGSTKARVFAYQEDWGNLTQAQISAMKPNASDYTNQ